MDGWSARGPIPPPPLLTFQIRAGSGMPGISLNSYICVLPMYICVKLCEIWFHGCAVSTLRDGGVPSDHPRNYLRE